MSDGPPRARSSDDTRSVPPGEAPLFIAVLSARGEVEDRVAGLDLGATDYMGKPFSFDELAARVRAHLRRPGRRDATQLEGAGIVLDLLTRTVTRDGTTVELSPREFGLLAYFLRHPNHVLSREQILSAVWGYDYDPGTNVVEVYVGYLRRKLSLPDRPAPIDTLRSVGYRLTDR
jgi:DNA-binding response OmpR family regulator